MPPTHSNIVPRNQAGILGRGNELCLEVLADPAFGSSLTDWAGLEKEPALLIRETVRGGRQSKNEQASLLT